MPPSSSATAAADSVSGPLTGSSDQEIEKKSTAANAKPEDLHEKHTVEYWDARWVTPGRSTWHREEPRRHFLETIRDEDLTGRVLLPLCGASPDLFWFAERPGVTDVIGIEFAPAAITKLIEERKDLEFRAVPVELAKQGASTESDPDGGEGDRAEANAVLTAACNGGGSRRASKKNRVMKYEFSKMLATTSPAGQGDNAAGTAAPEDEDKSANVYSKIKIYVADALLAPQYLEEHVGQIDLVFDCAALVALPVDLREKYLQAIWACMKTTSSSGAYYLATIDYPVGARQPPPNRLPPEEVEGLFAGWEMEGRVERNVVPKLGGKEVPDVFEDFWRLSR